MKIPSEKMAVDRELANYENCQRGMRQTRRDERSKRQQHRSSLRYIDEFLSSKTNRIGRTRANIQMAEWYCAETTSKTRWLCSIHRTRSIRFSNDSRMSDASRLLKLPKTECPTVWIRVPRNRRPNGPSATQSFWPSIGRTSMGKTMGRCLMARRLGESTQQGMSSFFRRQARLFLSVCGWLGEMPLSSCVV